MNVETKTLLSEYLLDKSIDEDLDEMELMDSYEEMEWQVWGVFEDWSNEDWDAAETKILRVVETYGRI